MTTKVTSVTKQPGSVGLAEAPATVVVLLGGGVAATQPANLIDTVGTIVIVEGAPPRSSAPGSGGEPLFHAVKEATPTVSCPSRRGLPVIPSDDGYRGADRHRHRRRFG